MKKVIVIIFLVLTLIGCKAVERTEVVNLEGKEFHLPTNWQEKKGSNGYYLTNLNEVIIYNQLGGKFNTSEMISEIKKALNFYDLGRFQSNAIFEVLSVKKSGNDILVEGFIQSDMKQYFKGLIFNNLKSNYLIVVANSHSEVDELYAKMFK